MRSSIVFVLDLNAATEDPIPTACTPVKIRIEVAVLPGFNQPLCLAQSCRIDEHNPLLFGCWVEEVRHDRRFNRSFSMKIAGGHTDESRYYLLSKRIT